MPEHYSRLKHTWKLCNVVSAEQALGFALQLHAHIANTADLLYVLALCRMLRGVYILSLEQARAIFPACLQMPQLHGTLCSWT